MDRMKNDAIYRTDLASRHNLFRLGLIRAVVLMGQGLALVYFSLIRPIDIPVSSIALVLAIFAFSPQESSDKDAKEVPAPSAPTSVYRLEWEHIQKVLNDNEGNISATARSLGMHRRTLQRKLQKKPSK